MNKDELIETNHKIFKKNLFELFKIEKWAEEILIAINFLQL